MNIKVYTVVTLLCVIFQTSYTQNYQDCQNSFPICEFKTYNFSSLKGWGKEIEEFDQLKCVENFAESNSIWLKWIAESDGILTFVITPQNPEDDIDFILFQEQHDCSDLLEVRCMASGYNFGPSDVNSQPCNGPTGLSSMSIDEFERSGCKYSDDNFLKQLKVIKGEKYKLLVNNFDSEEGISITFEGNNSLVKQQECMASDLKEDIIITHVFPNPTSSFINIQFLSLNESETTLEILDISGALIRDLTTVPMIGLNRAYFDLEGYTSGTYLIRLKQANFSTVGQFVIK